jgi:hypothetical protein
MTWKIYGSYIMNTARSGAFWGCVQLPEAGYRERQFRRFETVGARHRNKQNGVVLEMITYRPVTFKYCDMTPENWKSGVRVDVHCYATTR